MRDEFLIAQSYQNNGLTHSTTLLPMAEDLLRTQESPGRGGLPGGVRGPGPFTGLQWLSTVKGRLGWGADKAPGCHPGRPWPGIWPTWTGVICCAMDARRHQVYNALFRAREGRWNGSPDRAISLEELAQELKSFDGPKLLLETAGTVL